MTKAEMQMFHDVNDKCQALIRENKALKLTIKKLLSQLVKIKGASNEDA